MMAGEHLGRESHRQGDGEKQRIEHRLVEEHVDGEDDEYEDEHHSREQITQAVDAALELVFRRAHREPFGDLPERCRRAGLHDERPGRPAAHVGAHEDAVGALRQTGVLGHHARHFFNREGFTGEDSLAYVEIGSVQQYAVCRDQAAGREQYHIARHDVLGRDGLRLPVAQNGRFQGDLLPEFSGGVARTIFLEEAQERAAQHNCQDDDRIHPFPGHCRDAGSEE